MEVHNFLFTELWDLTAVVMLSVYSTPATVQKTMSWAVTFTVKPLV